MQLSAVVRVVRGTEILVCHGRSEGSASLPTFSLAVLILASHVLASQGTTTYQKRRRRRQVVPSLLLLVQYYNHLPPLLP